MGSLEAEPRGALCRGFTEGLFSMEPFRERGGQGRGGLGAGLCGGLLVGLFSPSLTHRTRGSEAVADFTRLLLPSVSAATREDSQLPGLSG